MKGFNSHISFEELDKRLKRVSVLIKMGALEMKDKYPVISGKYAANFYMQNGVLPEFLEDWINRYIKTGKYSLI